MNAFAVAARNLEGQIRKCGQAVNDLQAASAQKMGAYREIQARLQEFQHWNDRMLNAGRLFEEKILGGRHSRAFAPSPPDVEVPGNENLVHARLEMLFGTPWRELCHEISKINTPPGVFPVDPVAWEILPIQIDVLSFSRLYVVDGGIGLAGKVELAVDRFGQFLRLVQSGKKVAR
jgi:hypothetical protein